MSLAHGDAPFLVYEDERTTFAEHYRIACTLAHRLRSTFGIVQGDRVAIIMRNLPEWIMAFWGATLAGAIVVPLNAWWSGEELRYGLEDSGSKVAFVDTERAERIRPFLGGLSGLGAIIVADEHRTEPKAPLAVFEPPGGSPPVTEWPFPLALGPVDEAASPPDITIDPEDDATIFYTSGTTGRPKGAVGTHRNMCTNLMSLFFINTRGSMRFGAPALEPVGEKAQPAFLLSVPLFHATGCHSVMVSNVAAGGKIVMMHHFDPDRALELIERERIGTFGGVPAMVMQVLDSPNFSKFDTSSIRGVSYGGAPAPPDLVRRIREAWPVGQPSNGYGLTETSSVTSMISGGDYVAKTRERRSRRCRCATWPSCRRTSAVTSPTTPSPRGPDVRGELWIKGPNVVRGYWNRPDETAKTFSKGWLHTGDVARLDEDNFIYIVDRAKDMIIRGGENVYSVQVEAALFEHPAVADCAVIGVPDPTLGEEVGAVVVLRPGAKVTADELAAARQGAARRLHGADAHLVPQRAAAAQPPGEGAQARAARRARAGLRLRSQPSGGVGLPPVRPRSRLSSGASAGTGTAVREDADGPPLLGVRAHLVPDPLHELVREVRVHPDRPGDVVGPQGPELVDLPEVLAHRVVAEGQVGDGVEVRHGGGRGAGTLDDRIEVRHRIVSQEIAVELVRPRLLHGQSGQHVGHPGVVVGVVVDQRAQWRGLGPAPGGEGARQDHVPLVGRDLGDHAGQGPVGQHEGLGFGHRPLLGRVFAARLRRGSRHLVPPL